MTSTTTAARTTGIHHVGLTVPDISATADFFESALGFTRVGAKPDYPALFLSDGTVLVSLWQADATGVVPFDRRHNIGLHHLALRLAEPSALDRIHGELAARADTVIEFAPELLGGGPTRHMMCAIPGGIRLELIAPVAR
jgi:catechol 2,3-dioxygenase-like lactoylglutathione lyase family enzyme